MGNILKAQTATKSALGKALHYLFEQCPYLVRFLEDGRLELTNNRAERSMKPFVMGRKNFLFCNTPSGAQSGAVLYSLIETAKENGLNPYRYLTWVLEQAPALAVADDAWAEKLIPGKAPDNCKTTQNWSTNAEGRSYCCGPLFTPLGLTITSIAFNIN